MKNGVIAYYIKSKYSLYLNRMCFYSRVIMAVDDGVKGEGIISAYHWEDF